MKKPQKNKPVMRDAEKSYQTSFDSIVCVALLIILAIPSFISIYARHNYFIMHLVTDIPIMAILLSYNKDKLRVFDTYLDYILFGLTLLFLISIAWSIWPHRAIEEVFKYVNFFLIYWFVAKLVKREQTVFFIKTLFFLGAFMSLFGLVDYLDLAGIDFVVRDSRIIGTLMYTNAFAAYTAATFFLGLYLTTLKEKYTWVYSIGSFFMLVAFMGTLSRAMWLIFLPFFLLFVIGFKGEKRSNAINTVFLAILGLCSAFIVYSEINVAVKMLSLVAGAILGTLSARIQSNMDSIRLKPSHLIIGTAGSFVVLAFVIVQYTLNNRVLERIMQINLQESSVVARFAYYADAWRIIMDNPVLGYGGGAWQAIYQLYRTYLYHTTEIHSHILEIGVGTGIPGMLLFAAAILFIVYVLFKTKEPAVFTMCLASLLILSHSMLDLDLSIGYPALVTWAMMGAIANCAGAGVLKEIRIRKFAAVVLLFVYIAGSATMLVSAKYSNLGEKENFLDAYNKINKAITLYPVYAKNHATLADINFLAYQEIKDEKYLNEALIAIDKAIGLDKWNYNWYAHKARYLTENGRLEEALSLLKQKRNYLFRYDNEAYAETAQLLAGIAQKYEEKGDTAAARAAFQEVLQLWEEAKAEMAVVTPVHLKMWVEDEKLTDHDPFLLEVIRAYDYLGDKNNAQALLQELSPETIKQNEWLKNI